MSFERVPLRLTRLFEIHLNEANDCAHRLNGSPLYCTEGILQDAAKSNVGQPGSYSMNIIPDVSISLDPNNSVLGFQSGLLSDLKPFNVSDVQINGLSAVDSSMVATIPSATTSVYGVVRFGAYTDESSTGVLACPAGLSYQLQAKVYARLTVNSNISECRWYLDDNTDSTYPAGASIQVEPGEHVVHFLPVAYYSAPADSTIIVPDTNDKVAVTGVYTKLTGKLIVLLNSNNGKWTPNGGTNYYSSGEEVEVEGTCTISFTSVSGYKTPSTRRVTVTAGDSIVVSAVYKAS